MTEGTFLLTGHVFLIVRGYSSFFYITQGIVSLRPREGNSLAKITVPIALVIFKRTDTLQQIAEELNKHEISKLYIVADGPSTPEEEVETDRARSTAEKINAQSVERIYSEKNLGLRLNLTAGITRAFEDSEQLIILEDDCLPSEAFLESCERMRMELADDITLAGFCGSSFLPKGFKQKLWRSSKFSVWGWMANKQAWSEFIHSGFLKFDSKTLLSRSASLNKLPPLAKWEMVRIMKVLDEIDTWDVQFETFCIENGYDFLKPKQNLVRNIGFGEGATNTGEFGSSLSLEAKGSAIAETEIPSNKSQFFEWLEHSSRFSRLLGEFIQTRLFRKR